MLFKPIKCIACLLGLLLLSGVNGFAQNKGDGEKKAGLYVMVSTLPEKTEGSFGLVNLKGVRVYVTLSDGRRLSSVTSGQGTTFLKGLPLDGEYIAEVSPKGLFPCHLSWQSTRQDWRSC